MKLLILIIFLFSCAKHESQETKQIFADLQSRRDLYVSQIDDSFYNERCDKLTFKSLFSAFGKAQDLSGHEPSPGQWHRDTTRCYPHDSQSEISYDGLLGVFLNAQTTGNPSTVSNILDYGSQHDETYGEGRKDLVWLPQLRAITKKSGLGYSSDLSGFRGYIAAMTIWYRFREFGSISGTEKILLTQARNDNPGSPLLECLVSRFSDGDQTKSLDIMFRDYTDQIVKTTGRYGWGSSPDAVFFVVTVACLEGK